MRQDGFLDIACDVLSSAMLGLLRDVLKEQTEEQQAAAAEEV